MPSPNYETCHDCERKADVFWQRIWLCCVCGLKRMKAKR